MKGKKEEWRETEKVVVVKQGVTLKDREGRGEERADPNRMGVSNCKEKWKGREGEEERKGWGIGGADAKNKTRKEIQKGSGVIFMSERIMWLNMREYKEIWKIPEEEEVVLGKFDNDQICRVR